jgi:hypothetical protein
MPAPLPLVADAALALLARWVADRSPRTVTKRPYFRKSWQSGWARDARWVIAAAVTAAGRMPPPFSIAARLNIPDFGTRPVVRVVVKSIDWGEGASVLVHALPDSRTIFILRHPCGQVASVMRGNRQNRFDLQTNGTNMPFDEAGAIRFARSHGIDEPEFQALPDAAKYAWAWRSYNEPAYAALAAQPNVHVVLYEALCAEPEALSRRILAFAKLNWNRQTQDFVARSTIHSGQAGYYAIFRNTAASAEAWRGKMAPSEQEAVRSVVASSPLARFWPDLVTASLSSQVGG